MLYYILRRKGEKDSEGIALIRVNAKEEGNMHIGLPRQGRFGAMAPVTRNNIHVYNLIIGDHEEVEAALFGMMGWHLEQVSEAEWKTHEAFELFPILKMGIAR